MFLTCSCLFIIALHEVIAWINNFNKEFSTVDKRRIPINVLMTNRGGISLLEAAVYIEDINNVNAILNGMNNGFSESITGVQSALKLAESLVNVFKSERRKKILDLIRKFLGICSSTTVVSNNPIPLSKLNAHLSSYTSASFGKNYGQVADCKNFNSEEGCHFGRRCHFIHVPRLVSPNYPKLDQVEERNPTDALKSLYQRIYSIEIGKDNFVTRTVMVLDEECSKTYLIYSAGFTCPVNNFLILAQNDSELRTNDICWYKSEEEAICVTSRTAIRIIFYEQHCLKIALAEVKRSNNLNNIYQKYFPNRHLQKSCWVTNIQPNGSCSASFISPGHCDRIFPSPKDEDYNSERSAKVAALEVFIRHIHHDKILLEKTFNNQFAHKNNVQDSDSDNSRSKNSSPRDIERPVTNGKMDHRRYSNIHKESQVGQDKSNVISKSSSEIKKKALELSPIDEWEREIPDNASNHISSSTIQTAQKMIEKENNLQRLYQSYYPSESLKSTSWTILKKMFQDTTKYRATMESPGENNKKYDSHCISPGEWFFSERDAKRATFLSFLVSVLHRTEHRNLTI